MTRLIRELVCLLWTQYRPVFCSSDYPDWNVNSHKSNLKSQLHKICTYNCEICDKNPIPCSSWWASELWSMSKSEKITNVKGLCHGSRVDHPKQQHWSVHSPIFSHANWDLYAPGCVISDTYQHIFSRILLWHDVLQMSSFPHHHHQRAPTATELHAGQSIITLLTMKRFHAAPMLSLKTVNKSSEYTYCYRPIYPQFK